ncbi:asparagine synthase (glutamine-hydrolyzing) [bacterium]|nr:asparagine synthase (glutamine-hydrolyzing) [bacterium]
MCGIFGIIRPAGVTPWDTECFHSMGESLRHRGPDGSGYIEEPRALLGMHRLSIMDVTHGWQPFWSESGLVGVLGNGEIYNAASLRQMLEDRGHILNTKSDIEVVPHLFEEYGLEFVHSLRGMFALAVIDKEGDRLLLIRDRLGEKPLSYTVREGAFYFASEQTALVKSGAVSRDFDFDALHDYLLYGFSPEPRSLLTGVRKVPAGGILEIPLTTGTPVERVYWSPLDFVDGVPYTPHELAPDIQDAVQVATVSDVPVGVALSGGLDSSLVASMAQRSGVDLQAFSVGYPDAHFDESALAREFANGLGIPFHRIELRSDEVAAHYSCVSAMRDEPIADIAGPGLAAIPEAAHKHGVPVLLTGLGGDELFWGYEWVNRLANWSWQFLKEADGLGRAPRFTRRPTNRQALFDWLTTGGGARQTRDLRRLVTGTRSGTPAALPFYQRQPGYRRLLREIAELVPQAETQVLQLPTEPDQIGPAYIDALLRTFLRVNGLTQLDRLAMHYSIESRVPLIDHVLVERVMRSSLADQGFRDPPKSRLRAAAREVLPPAVTDRPKRGFTPPVREWLKEIWRQNPSAVAGESIQSSFGLEPTTVRRLMASPLHSSGQVNQLGLRLMTLELWLQEL